MKEGVRQAVLVGLLLITSSGCGFYRARQYNRANQEAQDTYDRSVADHAMSRMSMGTWKYSLEPLRFDKHEQLNDYQLTLYADGTFSRLHTCRLVGILHSGVSYVHERGEWQNRGNMVIHLWSPSRTNWTEIVDLSKGTNEYVRFVDELMKGIQPAARAYRFEDKAKSRR